MFAEEPPEAGGESFPESHGVLLRTTKRSAEFLRWRRPAAPTLGSRFAAFDGRLLSVSSILRADYFPRSSTRMPAGLRAPGGGRQGTGSRDSLRRPRGSLVESFARSPIRE